MVAIMIAIISLLIALIASLHHGVTREPVSAFIAVTFLGLSWCIGNLTFE